MGETGPLCRVDEIINLYSLLGENVYNDMSVFMNTGQFGGVNRSQFALMKGAIP